MPEMKSTYTVNQELVGLSSACPAGVFTCEWDRPVQVDAHDHEYYEIAIVRRGRAVHRTPAYERDIQPGSAIVMGPGQVHAYESVTGFDVTNVYYLAEWLMDDLSAFWVQDGLVPLFFSTELFGRSLLPDVSQFQLSEDELAACEHELSDLEGEAALEAPSALFLRSALLKLMVSLCRRFVTQCSEETAMAFRGEVWGALERVERAIAKGDTFSVADAATEADLSPDHFSRVFKGATGWTPQEYYQRRRVRHARRLLLDPARPLAEVSERMGFCDAAHFCNVFRRYEGMSPSSFRATYSPENTLARQSGGKP